MAQRNYRAPSATGLPVVEHGDWLISALLFVAIGAALGGLSAVLTDIPWWFVGAATAAMVLLAGATARALTHQRLWGAVAALLAGVFTITAFFAPGSAILGIIPTFDTFGALGEVEQEGAASIAQQALPADAGQGIVYLVCLGVAAIAFSADTFAFAARTPALTAIPLVVLLLVPSFVQSGVSNPVFFVLTAMAWLGILLLRAGPVGRRAAVVVGAVSVVAALVIPVVLPPVGSGASEAGAGGVSTGLNPILTLGADLRRTDPTLAVTYTTTAVGGVYLRLVALDDFTGRSWVPSSTDPVVGNDVESIDAAPGVGAEIAVTEQVTQVSVANIASRWLPVPYAPTTVTGLDGDWSWLPEALTIRTEASNARNQQYDVVSTQAAPSIEQLVAADMTDDPTLDPYLEVPEDLPPIVAETALEVVGDAASSYEMAIALQEYFTGGDFVYSVDAPVEAGYDGSGAEVLGQFLVAKSGYCVHFSSAMAAMARTLGIPARVAVGFVPGEATTTEGGEAEEYRVTTDDFHAWPELYFEGIGWVRFEPTPGRGIAPAFAPLSADDPTTPDIDESVPPAPSSAASATPTPSASASPDLPAEELADPSSASSDAATSAATWGTSLGVLAALLLATPALLRIVRRRIRLTAVARGSAASAWEELHDTAFDLGLHPGEALTPRQVAADLGERLDADGAAALARVRAAFEQESFAGRAGDPTAADLRRVIRSLRRSAGLWRSAVATAVPLSLVARWLPQRRAVPGLR